MDSETGLDVIDETAVGQSAWSAMVGVAAQGVREDMWSSMSKQRARWKDGADGDERRLNGTLTNCKRCDKSASFREERARRHRAASHWDVRPEVVRGRALANGDTGIRNTIEAAVREGAERRQWKVVRRQGETRTAQADWVTSNRACVIRPVEESIEEPSS